MRDSAGDQAVDDNQQDTVMNYRMSLQEDQLNGLQPQCSRDQLAMHRRFQDEMDRVESPVYRQMLANTSLRTPEEDKGQENTDTSRDPSTDNGESSGNSHEEVQQWSDTEDTNRVMLEMNDEGQEEIPCRVSWCEQTGKRYGLCWAHGGVKKCCHRNCPKIALDNGEFCSIHEDEISASTF
ncbi:hypothetical protein P3T76_003831 [Phytophthora citrophthora]|uniref:Uncharacterized protein n=1 Tax=Phytophthora citrophthora TaxID=4793 RepID=A0AAD9GW50_9STRA|nr:hypothetical protein P3T76_003831 [Phytophthora citrophthora]